MVRLIESPPAWWRRFMAPGALWRAGEPEGTAERKAPPEGSPTVWLTFDDGPTEGTTPWILRCLERYGVPATFFMVGDNVRRYAGLMERVLEQGHSVGNHTYHHLAAHRHGASAYMADVRRGGALIPGRLFRPPHGTLTPAVRRMLEAEGWHTVMYDVVTRDYSRRLGAAGVTANVRRHVRPGSLVVFHDSVRSIDKLRTALPESLEWLLERGYRFGVIDMESGLPVLPQMKANEQSER